jgi:hypothetical protein
MTHFDGECQETAADRVRAFLATQGASDQMIGTDSEIRVGDLKILVQQAEALRHAAPMAAQAIEIGGTT